MGFVEVTHRGDVPTSVQVLPHHGFASEAIHARGERITASEAPRTMQLATPPAWSQRDDMPCLNNWAPYDLDTRTISAKKAKALCFGCPVLEECLEDAMLMERDQRQGKMFGRPLGAQHRYGIRGGLTPNGRAERAGVGKAKPVVAGTVVSEEPVYGFCRNDHPLNDDTSVVREGGRNSPTRRCKLCQRANDVKMNAKRLASRTACKRGHEYKEGSFVMRPAKGGSLARHCLVCHPPKQESAA